MKVLFIRDLPSAITEYQLFEFFSDISGGRVERTKKVNDFAFVHFTDRQSAEEAKEAADLLLLDVSSVSRLKISISLGFIFCDFTSPPAKAWPG